MQTVVAHGRLLKSLGKTSGTLYGTERGKGPVPSRRLLENQAQKNVPVHLTAVCEEARHKHFAQAWEYKMRQNMLNSSESWFGNSKKKKKSPFYSLCGPSCGRICLRVSSVTAGRPLQGGRCTIRPDGSLAHQEGAK